MAIKMLKIQIAAQLDEADDMLQYYHDDIVDREFQVAEDEMQYLAAQADAARYYDEQEREASDAAAEAYADTLSADDSDPMEAREMQATKAHQRMLDHADWYAGYDYEPDAAGRAAELSFEAYLADAGL
jgi:hypothetical protein